MKKIFTYIALVAATLMVTGQVAANLPQRIAGGVSAIQAAKQQGQEQSKLKSSTSATELVGSDKLDDEPGDAAVVVNELTDEVLTVPYINDIYNNKGIGDLTFVDCQGGGDAWSYLSKASYRAIRAYDGSQWVVLPLLHLESDVRYVLNLYGHSASDSPTYMHVAIGSGDDPDAYTDLIADSLLYSHTPEVNTYADHLIPFFAPNNVAGDYRIAFRVLANEVNDNYTWIRLISVEAGSVAAAPDSVSVFEVMPAPLGALSATVSVTTPTLDLAGNALTGLTELRVYRNDNELVYNVQNPELGVAYTFEDNEPVNGFNTYTAVCANEAGDSPERQTKAYIGVDKPDWPENVRLLDLGTGTYRLTWDLPKGQNGGYINPETTHYIVFYYDNNGLTTLAENVEGYSYDYERTYEGSVPGDQKVMQLAVAPVNEIGSGYARAADVLLGKPYVLPFIESYADQNITTNPWVSVADNGGTISFVLVEDSQDDDHGSFNLSYATVGETAIFKSPLIDISSVQQPVLSFYYYAKPGQGLTTDVILLKNQLDCDTVAQIDHRTLTGEEGWRKMTIDLTDYVDSRYVRLSFNNHILENSGVCRYDNIRIENTPNTDLAVKLDAPFVANPGEDITVTATVTNVGMLPLTDEDIYTLNIYVDDQLIATEEEADLAADESQSFVYTYTVPDGERQVALRAVVSVNGDTEADNDVATHSVGIDTQVLNAISDLEGDIADQVTLTWSQPVNTERLTDTFEDYPAFACDTIGNYTCVNYQADAYQRYIIDAYFPNSNHNYAFYLFSAHEPGYDKYATLTDLQAHSGDKMLYTTSLADDGLEHNDAWIISPELSGEEQVMTFWAKTYAPRYGLERVQLYYSTQGADAAANGPRRAPTKEQFSLVLDTEVPGDWTQFGAYLPEGTKYFAIRYCSYDKFIMFMDDFTYNYGEKVIDHYNIYRNGELIGTGTEPIFSDQDGNTGDEYTVTVVYADGQETAPSNAYIVPVATAVRDITAEHEADSAIYNLAGQRMRGDLNSLPRGIYIVGGKKVVK